MEAPLSDMPHPGEDAASAVLPAATTGAGVSMSETDPEFKTYTVDGVRRIEHIMIELEQAREFSPLDEAQLHAWQTISHQPGAVQELLDASPTYQAMLAARGVR